VRKKKESTTSELHLLEAVDSHVQVQHNVAAVRDQNVVPYILQSFVLQFLELLEETWPIRSISISVNTVQDVVWLFRAKDSGGWLSASSGRTGSSYTDA
jgi:predicted thioredoxin/glutaredoxin